MTRKRANSTKNKKTAKTKTKSKIATLKQSETQYFQELVEISSRYAAMLKQEAQYEFIIHKLEENRKKIQDGEIKLPIVLPLIPNVMYYSEFDKKKIFEFFDTQITSYKNSIKALKGQLEQRYEAYIESGVRVREFLIRRYGTLTAKQIVPDRKTVGDEENLFEAEFNKLMEDPKTKEEFKKAKKEAIQHNIKRAIKNKSGK